LICVSGDYQFNFDGSSDEDKEVVIERKKSTTTSKSKRTKECPGCGSLVAISLRECRFCDYQFTSKSLLVNQQSAAQESQTIRDKFPFEPERVSIEILLAIEFALNL
jgi:ribosomal protein L37AE/L43A